MIKRCTWLGFTDCWRDTVWLLLLLLLLWLTFEPILTTVPLPLVTCSSDVVALTRRCMPRLPWNRKKNYSYKNMTIFSTICGKRQIHTKGNVRRQRSLNREREGVKLNDLFFSSQFDYQNHQIPTSYPPRYKPFFDAFHFEILFPTNITFFSHVKIAEKTLHPSEGFEPLKPLTGLGINFQSLLFKKSPTAWWKILKKSHMQKKSRYKLKYSGKVESGNVEQVEKSWKVRNCCTSYKMLNNAEYIKKTKKYVIKSKTAENATNIEKAEKW